MRKKGYGFEPEYSKEDLAKMRINTVENKDVLVSGDESEN